jgi:hypothetical protein
MKSERRIEFESLWHQLRWGCQSVWSFSVQEGISVSRLQICWKWHWRRDPILEFSCSVQ